jgi:hypothetical protein
MRYRNLLFGAAVILPIAGIVAAVGPAAAGARTVKGTGTVTCALGGDVTFTPPLTPDGTPGDKNEVVQFNLSASDCAGLPSNSPQPGPTGATVTVKPIKFKDDKLGKGMKVAGACSDVSEFTQKTLHLAAVWQGVTIKGTKVVYHIASGASTAKGSYFGAAAITLAQTAASQDQFESVCNPSGGSGSDATIDVDPTMSSLMVGSSAVS